MSFDPVQYAHDELTPILHALVTMTQEEASADQQRFFAGVLSGVERAADGTDLADPFMQLSMSAFMGFEFSPAVAMLLDQLLAKAQRLSEALSLDASEIN